MMYVRTQANVSIPEYKYACVNAKIHMLTQCLYNDKLMLILPNIKYRGKIYVYILYVRRKLI